MQIEFSLEEDLQNLMDCDGVEIYEQPTGEDQTLNIPFMMNDAVECYLSFSHCKVMGKWDPTCEEKTSFSLITDNGKKGLILRQGRQNTITIWYEGVTKHMDLYQYHRIGHFWVSGQEYMRRLVYIVGTIHDKHTFLGKEICNELECSLFRLMEFAPFRYYSPIHESLDSYYEDSIEGIQAMRAILKEHPKPKKLLRKLASYEKKFQRDGLYVTWIERFAKLLEKDPYFYAIVDQKIEKASSCYAERSYSQLENDQILQFRETISKKYQEKGFQGSYPFFYQKKSSIYCFEELPYVLRDFEYEDYGFQIHPTVVPKKLVPYYMQEQHRRSCT